ncbi:MAG TPA: MFS transporter [Verrucomicrobiae bacterium]|jgi:OPA family glycerol-3-phosphate transporter-like MFS transporter|nr:MFS transporter [Verrucomicrobiae bacterium]
MTQESQLAPQWEKHPPGFRARRGLNWGFLGLLYTSFYLCRYNLSIANKAISETYGFTRADMGLIITTALLTYAFGQILNGLLTDKLGGKRAMLIGAAGTVVMNLLFGAVSLLPFQITEIETTAGPLKRALVHFHLFHGEVFLSLISFFVVVRGIDGYLQAFGAPGMIKINTAWFAHRERGRFAGIFGFMINLGRFGIFKFGPALLAGFVFLGLWRVPPLHWRWLFWAPSAVCGLVALCMALIVKETPEEIGLPVVGEPENKNETVRLRKVLIAIISNPVVWITALAYSCTGAVRQSVDQWFPRYMQEVHHLDLASAQFQFLGFMIPFVASAGSLISGYLSDTVFKGRRAPVAAGIYFAETIVILAAAQFHSANAAICFFILIALTANSTHSLLGTASAMDIGGRKMVGFASGIIDSFQYFGGSLAGYFLGRLLDRSWGYYFYFMAPFGLIGGLLMLSILGKVTSKTSGASGTSR